MKKLPSFAEYCDYDKLEKAAKELQLDLENNEEKLLNLHNHLIWHSYRPTQDGVMDAIFLSAMETTMAEYHLGKDEIPIELLLYMEAIKRSENYGRCNLTGRA